MSKNLDFKTTPVGIDTGDATSTSIAPIENGEALDQAVLRRPTEALRQRIETLRIEANENRWLRDNDRASFFFLDDGPITWGGTVAGGGTGALTIGVGDTLIIVPATSPGAPAGGANEGSGSRFPTRFNTVTVTDTVEELVLISKLFAFEGAADISVEIVDDTGIGASVVVEVLGDATVDDPGTQPGRRRIVVTYNSNESHTLQDISDAITADPVANLLVEELSISNGAYPAFEQAQTFASGGADGVFHQINAAELDAFFSTNDLKLGDTLVIWFSSVQNRRESIEENGNKHLVPASSLRILRDSDSVADNCVVVGRVVEFGGLGGSLAPFVLGNGQALEAGLETLNLNVTGAGLLQRLMKSTAGMTPITYQNSTVGAEFVGVDASAWNYFPTITRSVAGALDDADDAFNELFNQNSIHRLRGDVTRGLVLPPTPNDVGTYGAEYVGLDPNITYDALPDLTNNSVQDAIASTNAQLMRLRNGVSVGPGDNGTDLIGATAGAFPVWQPATDSLSDVLTAAYNRFIELEQRLTPYDSLADMIAATAPGEAAYVWRPYGQDSPFELEETLTGATKYGPMTGDGSRLFLATGTTVQSFATDDLTTPLVTFALSGTATDIVKLVCNGTHLLVSYITASNDLYDLFLVDGTLLGTRSAALSSTTGVAAMNGTHAFVVTTNTVQQVPLSSFSAGLTLEYDHTAIVTWIALHADQLVVYGAARVSDDGFALTGDRLIGLVPAGAGMTPLWGTTRTITPGTAVSDGNLIYSVSAGSGTELSLTSWGTGIANRADMTITEDVGLNFADGEYADGEYFYLLSQGLLYVYDRATFGCVARRFVEETETSPGHVFSDGDQVYVSTADSGVSYTLRRYSIRSGRPRLFGRQDPADKGKTFHNVLAVAQ